MWRYAFELVYAFGSILFFYLVPLAFLDRLKPLRPLLVKQRPAFFFALSSCLFLTSSILYRVIVSPLGVSFWGFTLLYGFMLVVVLLGLRSAEERGLWKSRMQDWYQVLRPHLVPFFLAVLLLLGLFFLTLRHQGAYYQDEYQRMAIAQGIKEQYPPADLFVFTDQTYRQYNFNELWAVNLSQATHLKLRRVYLYWNLLANWFSVLLGFWILVGTSKPNRPWLTLLLFCIFFGLQGIPGDQKISHLTFRQNTFALAHLLVGAKLLLDFLDRPERWGSLAMAAWCLAALVGIKLLALASFLLAVPFFVFDPCWNKKISIKTVAVIGFAGLSLAALWYFWLVRAQGDSAKPQLLFSPNHYWAFVYAIRIAEQYGITFFADLLRWTLLLFGNPGYFFWVPLVYGLSGFLTAAFALYWHPFKPLRGYVYLMLGGWFSMVLFALFKFPVGGSEGSIVYLIFFGSWLFEASAYAAFAHAWNLEDRSRKYGLGLLAVVTAFLLYFGGYSDLRHFRGPPSHYVHSATEMEAMKEVREHTSQQGYVLSNYYKIRQLWSFVGLTGRHSVVSNLQVGAINQSEDTYLPLIEKVDAFFSGTIPPEQSCAFLLEYQVETVFWQTRIHPLPGNLAQYSCLKSFSTRPDVTLFLVQGKEGKGVNEATQGN